jgi:cytochrome b561
VEAVNQLADSDGVVQHGTSRFGRWLRQRRTRFALWIAAVEAIIVAVFHDVSRWTVIALAIVAVAIYAAAGRSSRSDSLRQLSWIFAASQLLAVIAAILAFIVFWTAIIAVAIFAVIALWFVFTDRR